MTVLRSLTLRGRAFVCVGLAIGVGAVLVGERDLLRVAILVTAVPLVCALAVARTPRRVEHTRRLSPSRVPVGGDCRVVLTLTNSAPSLPVGPVLVEDRLPYALGEPPRFTVGLLRPGERRTFSYRLRSHVRGRYPVGPLSLGFVDPLGCARREHRIGPGASLLVTPAVLELPDAPGPGGTTAAGQSPSRAAANAGDDDMTPREYRHGDDLRRVHWRSTARRGQLMVRRVEQRRREHSTLLLDMRSAAHTGAGAASSVEGGITMAASIALHLLSRGQRLRLVVDDTETDTLHRPDGALEALAVVRSSPAPSLLPAIARAAHDAAGGAGTLVAVVGALRDDEVAALAACRPGAAGGRLAVLTPGAAWAFDRARARAAESLAGAGWRVLEPERVDQLPELWGAPAGGAR